MLEYIPIKDGSGRPIGRLTGEEGRYLLKTAVEAEWTLVTDRGEVPIREGEPSRAGAVQAVYGVVNRELLYWGKTAAARSTRAELAASLKRKYGAKKGQEEAEKPQPQADGKGEEPPKSDTPQELTEERSAQAAAEAEAETFDPRPTDDGAEMVQVREEQTISDSARQAASFAALQAAAHACYARWSHPDLPIGEDVEHGVKTVQEEREEGHRRPTPAPSAVPSETARRWCGEVERFLRQPPSEPTVDLFPRVFPNAVWRPVFEQGRLVRYEADWRQRGRRFRLLAVPVSFAPRPPKGFARFLKSGEAGYWISVQERTEG